MNVNTDGKRRSPKAHTRMYRTQLNTTSNVCVVVNGLRHYWGNEMAIHRALREQAKFYASKGFHIISATPRAGSHWLAVFAEFPEPQIVTANMSDPRAWRNNVAHYRRLKERNHGSDTRGESQGQDQEDS